MSPPFLERLAVDTAEPSERLPGQQGSCRQRQCAADCLLAAALSSVRAKLTGRRRPEGRKVAAVEKLGTALADARACLASLQNDNSKPFRGTIIKSILRDMDAAAFLLREHGWASAHDEFFPYDRATAHAAAVSGELGADSDYESADDHSAKRAKTAAAGATEVEKCTHNCIHMYLMY